MKTIEEAAKAQSLKTMFDLPCDQLKAEMTVSEWRSWFEDEFKAGVEFAQRWIKVKEELPNERGKYLVKATNIHKGLEVVLIAEWMNISKQFYLDNSSCGLIDVTHWRPINYK